VRKSHIIQSVPELATDGSSRWFDSDWSNFHNYFLWVVLSRAAALMLNFLAGSLKKFNTVCHKRYLWCGHFSEVKSLCLDVSVSTSRSQRLGLNVSVSTSRSRRLGLFPNFNLSYSQHLWLEVLMSRLSMLMQLKLVLSAYCSPIFVFQVCLIFFNFQIGVLASQDPLVTPTVSWISLLNQDYNFLVSF